jgi:hypothetical protein
VGITHLVSPEVGSGTVAVTHGGKCSDLAGVAVDFSGVDIGDPIIDSQWDEKHSAFIIGYNISGGVGACGVGGAILKDSSVDDISVNTGVQLHEIDLGSYVCSAAYNENDSPSIKWNITPNFAVAVSISLKAAVGGAIAPTSVILGPLVGPMGGPI